MSSNLFSLFAESLVTHPGQTALVADGEAYTYSELGRLVDQWAHEICKDGGDQIACLVSRSATAYASILAVLKCGKTYVPLNPNFPPARNAQILELSGAASVAVDEAGLAHLAGGGFGGDIRMLVPDTLSAEVAESVACTLVDTSGEHAFEAQPAGDYAYILFTSGSTGTPKGVPVRHTSVLDYVSHLQARYEFVPTDRFSQTFDLTFDLSVHDMFLCWQAGAALYSIPEKVLMGPAKFIKENELTVWFSVPSLAQFMNRFRMLKPDAFAHLRWSLFCGEPLPTSVVHKWQLSAPNSRLENIYGPTEATIGISHYEIPADPAGIADLNGIVSIGTIFASQQFCLVDEAGEVVDDEGELCLAGSQIADGYWNNPEKTAAQFVSLPGLDGTWYRTGDLVRQIDGDLFYVDRLDFQVKIRGYRIELGEINNVIAQITGTDLVFSLPFPVVEGVAESIYAFVSDSCELTSAEIISELGPILPGYMVPKEIHFVGEFPLNANGKIDRIQLTESIDSDAR